MSNMITVTFKLHGWLTKYFPESDVQKISIPENSTVKVVLERFSLPVEATDIIIRGKKSCLEQILSDGDIVFLYPIVFGG